MGVNLSRGNHGHVPRDRTGGRIDTGSVQLAVAEQDEKERGKDDDGWHQTVARVAVVFSLACSFGTAQVASHRPVKEFGATSASAPAPTTMGITITGKAVARVNGVELTDRDLLREMMALFPYARQHNGFPKGKEAEIRQGALQMIEFEEMVYQEAERRKMTIPAERLDAAEADFRRQFDSKADFDLFVKTEGGGSRQALRKMIRRSLLINKLLKVEVSDKVRLSAGQLRAFYDKNPERFTYGEKVTIQTISIFGHPNDAAKVQQETRKRAEDALRQAKAAKNDQEFGLLAEKVSEDDFHVNMGVHKSVELRTLPPEISAAVQKMAPGQVSELIQVDKSYTFFRLDARTPAGKVNFEQVKDRLRKDLEKARYEELRAALGAKLRQSSKVEEL